MSNLHLRLYRVTVPDRRAVVSVDQFYVSSEATLAWAIFKRLDDGSVMYSLREAGNGRTTRGSEPTARRAIEALTAIVEKTYGPVANPIGYDYRDGLDNMGLWTALGVDPGTPPA